MRAVKGLKHLGHLFYFNPCVATLVIYGIKRLFNPLTAGVAYIRGFIFY